MANNHSDGAGGSGSAKASSLAGETPEMIEHVADAPTKTGLDQTKLEIEEATQEERVTAKAWLCVFFLSLSFGTPFWATPTTPYISAPLLERFGQPQLSSWVVPCITTAATITILLFSTNSDLFGRRPFLLFSNIVNITGYAVMATAKGPYQFITGVCLNGCGSGTAGVALIACPELLPNSLRHVGVILADGFIYLMVIIGPVVGRAAINHDDDRWRYIYWAGFIIACVAFLGLLFFYFPPKHPRGVPWKDAVKGLDWVGALLFTPGAVMVLVTYTTYIPASDKRVIICFVLGFALIIAFGLWEQFSGVKYPLCPTSIFKSHKGREFTAPFCLSFIVVGFFYGLAVIYPQMLNSFYYDENTTASEEMLLTLPPNIGMPFGAMCLMIFGKKIGHWRWTLIASVTSLVLWGSLIAMITPFNKAAMIAFVCLGQISYGWAAYLAVTFTQLGVPQEYLGISGGLAGLARYAGGAIASACYSSAIGNGIRNRGMALIPKAALDAGYPAKSVNDLTASVIASGPTAMAKISDATPAVVEAVTTAYKWSAAFGLRNAALASLAFGVVGIALALVCEDITPKMTPKIEIFLENDTLADKNKYH